jgi:hypothetical protein
MRAASERIFAPSTMQYQSIISRRRLVCSTICDSFLGDAMISSLALRFRRIGASETRASQQPNPNISAMIFASDDTGSTG